jgi:dihydroxyacetone kinase-like protein
MIDCLSLTQCRALVAAWRQVMSEQRDNLIALDQLIGDGDLGITMQKAFAAAADAVPGAQDGIGEYFFRCGMAMAKAAPSTMGTLMATGFMRGGKALPAAAAELDGHSLVRFFNAFTQGIADRGKARPGDKTVLDVLLPASQALSNGINAGASLSEAAEAAYQSAEQGLAATCDMLPQHGKAASFVEKSIGIADPGGSVAVILFQVLRDFIRRN